ncbi:M42 family metallopeptidase [bacterium]|nr:M42 family metallopeptidase [bacterium]
MDISLLEKLSDLTGVSGYEEKIRELVKEQLKRYTDDIKVDNLGNLIAHIPGGKKPRVELDAHTDEVGFMVNHIEENGFLRILPIGGIDPRLVYGQRLKIFGKTEIIGVVGSVPPHLYRDTQQKGKEQTTPIEDLFVDVGLPKDKVKEIINIGDIATFDTKFVDLGDSVCGKAFDDRMGLFVILQALEKAKKIDCDLYIVGAVQEEFGLRGAKPAAFRINPDIAIAVEGTIANDIPGVPGRKSLSHLGGGASIRLSDRLMLTSRDLADFLISLAKNKSITHQVIVKRVGSTNAAVIQLVREGVKVAAISVPCRYVHSPQSIANKSDIENTIELIAEFIQNASKFKKYD